MKIVVTGALGHIGSKLIRTLPEQFPEAEIVLLDNLSTQRYCSLFNLPSKVKYSFHEVDILKDDLTPYILNAEVVVHLAAIITASNSYENKEEVERVNQIGTERVAEYCSQLHVPLLFVSTTSVYDLQEGSVDEEVSLDQLHPSSPYSQSKLSSEKMLQQLAVEKNINYTVLRFGTIFGISPGMRFHTAVNRFVWQASMGIPLSIWNTALHQERPYADLNDAVRAICFIIGKKCYKNTEYNVVTLNITVDEIVKNISKYVKNTKIKFVDDLRMNELSYSVQREKIEKLGFKFTGNLDSAIQDTLTLLKGTSAYNE